MANDFRAWKRLFSLQLHNAASLRASFLVQVIGMMVNNFGIAIAWVLFISVFGSVNGWGVVDVLAVQGIGSLAFGIAYTFANGAISVTRDIRRGDFDQYMLRPLRVLPLVWRSSFMESTFGDIVYGVVLTVIACALSANPFLTGAIALVVTIPGAMIMVAMSTVTSSYSFWRPDDRLLSDMLMRVFMVPTLYPAGAFPDVMRILFSVFIPSLLVAGIPWETARDHVWLMIVVLWLAAFAWLAVASWVFYQGVKHYESGGGVG